MKLGAPGVRLETLGELPFAGERLPAAALSFDPGAAPGGRFVLYADPASRRLRAMVYGPAEAPAVVVYEDFQETEGVTFARRWQLRRWDAERHAPGESVGKVVLGSVDFVELREDAFEPPEGDRPAEPE